MPGVDVIDTHYHTGPVFAVTQSGEWFYKEYPDKINKAGSYLYEPAHSVHTITVAEDATEDAVVWFAIFGSNVNIDHDGNVISVLDANYNPTLCEICDVATAAPTMYAPVPTSSDYRRWLVNGLLDHMLSASSSVSAHQCKQLLGKRYMRVDGTLPRTLMAIDDTSESYVKNLRGHASLWFEEFRDDILALLAGSNSHRATSVNGVD